MTRLISSKNMSSVGELTVVADIRQDLVDVRQTLTHATRLRMLLRLLYAIRLGGVEEAVEDRPVGPLEKLEFLQFVRFSIFDNDTKFLLAVTFDGAWEPYIRAIAEQGGPLLDAIFCHCVGYNEHSSDRGYEVFAEWVREHQVEVDFFYADSPGATALDVRSSQSSQAAICDAHRPGDQPGASKNTAAALAADELRAALRALGALHGLAPLFPRKAEQRFLGRTAKMLLEDVDIAGGMRAMPPPLHLPHEPAVKWLASFEFPVPPTTSRPIAVENPDDIQANILDQYDGMTHGCLLLVRIAEPRGARRFLREKLNISTYSGRSGPRPRENGAVCNLGLTFEGLRRLGASDKELASLPRDFQEGMEARAGWLGDLGVNHPNRWNLPKLNWPLDDGHQDLRVSLSAVDLVIQLQTRVDSETDLPAPTTDTDRLTVGHPLFAAIEKLALEGGSAIQILAVEVQRRAGTSSPSPKPWVTEHFGYRDGMSQPTHEESGPTRDRVNLGEILLGYPDDRDADETREPAPLCKNGTFMVIRKLQQDVRSFRQIIDEHGKAIPDLPSQMMGRDQNGVPVVAAPDNDLNDFDYENGSRQATGPRNTHIRRTNPRNGPERDERPRNRISRAVPRILRRGLSYGPDYRAEESDSEQTVDRGLLFMCYNASIADQFEVIQRWISGGNSTGLLSVENDPFMGLPIPGQHKHLRVRDRKGETRTIDLGRKPLVNLQWGLYLFVPSISALRELGSKDDKDRDDRDDPAVIEGEQLIRKMELLLAVEKLRDPEHAHETLALQWKKLIEDISSRETMLNVWAAIRARGGALKTPYGMLVGSANQVMGIFRNHDDYSVSGYWNRMENSLGEHYLGMDPDPQTMAETANPEARRDHARYRAAVDSRRYGREATLANQWISSQREGDSYLHAYSTTTQVIDELVQVMPGATVLDLRRLVFDVVARMCPKWFGLPDGVLMKMGGPYPAEAHCPDNFSATARYVFSPNPTSFVIEEGKKKGVELIDAAREFVRTKSRESYEAENLFTVLYDDLVSPGKELSETQIDLIARCLAGSIHGFVGPVGGSTISLLNEWTKSGELWRQQFELARSVSSDAPPTFSETSFALGEAIRIGMQIQPFPYILHRVPVRDVELEQTPQKARPFTIPVRAGTRVVLGIVSATRDQEPGDTEVLFGGEYRKGGPAHACPGKKIAMGTIAGVVAAIFRSGNLAPLGPLSLSLSRD